MVTRGPCCCLRILNKGGRRDNQGSTFLGRFVSLTLAVPPQYSSLVFQTRQSPACLLSWLVQPCLTVALAHVTLREPLESLGSSIQSFPPDLRGNFSSQLKVWICMLRVGIHFGQFHCDRCSHLFLLTRFQAGKPIPVDSMGYLWVDFCERECLAPRYPGPFPVLWIRPVW